MSVMQAELCYKVQ